MMDGWMEERVKEGKNACQPCPVGEHKESFLKAQYCSLSFVHSHTQTHTHTHTHTAVCVYQSPTPLPSCICSKTLLEFLNVYPQGRDTHYPCRMKLLSKITLYSWGQTNSQKALIPLWDTFNENDLHRCVLKVAGLNTDAEERVGGNLCSSFS